jgi:hypothetical protein
MQAPSIALGRLKTERSWGIAMSLQLYQKTQAPSHCLCGGVVFVWGVRVIHGRPANCF